MNEIVNSADADRMQSLKTIGMLSYLLHTVVAVAAVLPGLQVSAGLLVVAFVMDLVKKPDAAGTWQQTHFSWRIRTVMWAAFWYTITIPLWLLLYVPGWIAWGIISIWFLYRVVRGWSAMNDGKPMPI